MLKKARQLRLSYRSHGRKT